MAKGGNSLQAVLNRAKADGDAAPAPAPAIEPVDVSRKAPPSGRQGTKLIGGHFPPEVSTQLRIIAAEEGTTVQSLLGEALDDLFVKKGRGRIAKLWRAAGVWPILAKGGCLVLVAAEADEGGAGAFQFRPPAVDPP